MLVRNEIMAICAAALALFVLIGIVTFGGGIERTLALWAGFAGALSQFAGQDRSPISRAASVALAYIGFALALCALVLMSSAGGH
ncbi:hypothetical protein [Aminobacter sp. MDW-2]|uniref:hypothetical protein n=1 Tax=Aminobacter sp. MDW-2 TaxID=2666139 RepID=UPI0012AFBD1A|nr:hypothetical protein [Aminobacter sp. MDW-2]MRX32792.1 hypothetical protein [Aminobacter sp. MDW-2]QNH34546.1 hypothetical protein H5P29_00915 [Aminobacter sp. MDW-2]